jgi:hypothetical protein
MNANTRFKRRKLLWKEKSMATTIVSVDEIKSNRLRFVFCTIPAWAKKAEVDERGNVLRWIKR